MSINKHLFVVVDDLPFEETRKLQEQNQNFPVSLTETDKMSKTIFIVKVMKHDFEIQIQHIKNKGFTGSAPIHIDEMIYYPPHKIDKVVYHIEDDD